MAYIRLLAPSISFFVALFLTNRVVDKIGTLLVSVDRSSGAYRLGGQRRWMQRKIGGGNRRLDGTGATGIGVFDAYIESAVAGPFAQNRNFNFLTLRSTALASAH